MEKKEKRKAFLEAFIASMSPERIEKWFNDDLTGDKLADTWDFPEWVCDGKLEELFTESKLEKFRNHLWDKYSEWFKDSQKWNEEQFNARFDEIIKQDSKGLKLQKDGTFKDKEGLGPGDKKQIVVKGRYAMLKEDYKSHIDHVIVKYENDKMGLRKAYVLALAIYSSSQYTAMNSLSRGNNRGKIEGIGEIIDIWFTGYASIALKKLGKAQRWHESLPVVEDKDNVPIDEHKRENLRMIRRDMQLHDSVIDREFLKPKKEDIKWESYEGEKDNTDTIKKDWDKQVKPLEWEVITNTSGGDTGFKKPNRNETYRDPALMSSTINREGVPPFCTDSNVVLFIELYDKYAPFPAGDISSLSVYPKEKEILWAPSTEFLITKIRDKRQGPDSLFAKEGDFRRGSRKWSEKDKLEVYLRPKTAFDNAKFSFLKERDVQKWLDENMIGDKIVDTDKFPEWKERPNDSLEGIIGTKSPDLKGKYFGHLIAKYRYWNGWKSPSSMFKGFDKSEYKYWEAKFEQIWKAEKRFLDGDSNYDGTYEIIETKNRNEILGEDYLAHIRYVANALHKKLLLQKDFSLAIAIYSSSEYGKMNFLSRGQTRSPDWHADPFHLWISAKAAVGIDAIGKAQKDKFSTGVYKSKTWENIKINETDVPILRRDEGKYLPKENITALINTIGKPDGEKFEEIEKINAKIIKENKSLEESKQKTLLPYFKSKDENESNAIIFKPNFLFSTTKKIDGVSPFNEDSPLVWLIDVSEASDNAAMDISSLSAYPQEAEILWRVRQEFRIIQVINKSNEENIESKMKKVFVVLKALPFKIDLYEDQIKAYYERNKVGK